MEQHQKSAAPSTNIFADSKLYGDSSQALTQR